MGFFMGSSCIHFDDWRTARDACDAALAKGDEEAAAVFTQRCVELEDQIRADRSSGVPGVMAKLVIALHYSRQDFPHEGDSLEWDMVDSALDALLHHASPELVSMPGWSNAGPTRT